MQIEAIERCIISCDFWGCQRLLFYFSVFDKEGEKMFYNDEMFFYRKTRNRTKTSDS